MCNLSLEDANVGFIDKTVIRKEKHQGKEKEKKATRTRITSTAKQKQEFCEITFFFSEYP